MKNIIPYVLLFILFNSCSNVDDSPDCQGIDCLPPITQTGAGTFGCLVNGEPFFGNGGVVCFYQLVDGEYFFAVGLPRGAGSPRTVSIESSAKELIVGSQSLNVAENGSIYGSISFDASEQFIINTTDSQNTGTLTITNLNLNDQIVSGTFEFSVLNQNNDQIVRITEGRFDSFFTR